jgi:hypothetical protein
MNFRSNAYPCLRQFACGAISCARSFAVLTVFLGALALGCRTEAADASQPAKQAAVANPFDQAAQASFAGRFHGPGVQMRLKPEGAGWAGTIVFKGQSYMVQAALRSGVLEGTFGDGQQAWLFSISGEGDKLSFTAGTVSVKLERRKLPKLAELYETKRVRLQFENREGQTNGTIRFNGREYRFTATEVAGDLEGSFSDGNDSFPFTIANEPRALVFRNGSFTEILTQEPPATTPAPVYSVPAVPARTAAMGVPAAAIVPSRETERFSEGRARIEVNSKYGFIDRGGKVVIEPYLDDAGVFIDGWARARLHEKWGFIDKGGRVVIEPRYDGAGDFNDGLARVKLGRWGFIDRGGKLAIEPRWDDAGAFASGLVNVAADGRWGFANRKGEFAIEPRFEEALPFSDGWARTKFNGQWGFVDRDGKPVIRHRFEEIGPFREGRAKAQMNGRWGFIDQGDKLVIEPRFEDAGDFREGRAAAKLDGRWGFIDKSGKFAVPVRYEDAGAFFEGRARVRLQGQWGFIDKGGKWLIEARFEDAWDFSEGRAKVRVGGQDAFIDENGRVIWSSPNQRAGTES